MQAIAPHRAGYGFESLRILVADDNDVLRGAMQRLFRLLGHSADAVSNGREAVEAAARQEYGLILLDIEMPEMDGLEAARLIRSDCSGGTRARIIGLSAEVAELPSLKAAGMDAYLRKPVLLADLIGVLSRLPRLNRTSTSDVIGPTWSTVSGRTRTG